MLCCAALEPGSGPNPGARQPGAGVVQDPEAAAALLLAAVPGSAVQPALPLLQPQVTGERVRVHMVRPRFVSYAIHSMQDALWKERRARGRPQI
jgi:hypothetical protein